MGNWEAERSLHEFTGIYRTKPAEHIPKRGGQDFELPPLVHNKVQQNTSDRIHGLLDQQILTTTMMDFEDRRKSISTPKTGLRAASLERKVEAEIRAEVE